jgi:hypothetical protein
MFLRPIGGASSEEHPMQQFIPFEDDWDALENLRAEDLIPYRAGLLDNCAALSQRNAPAAPASSGPQAGSDALSGLPTRYRHN